MRAWASSRARGTVSTGTRSRAGQLLDPVELRRGVLILGQHDPAHRAAPDREQLEHGAASLDLITPELAARARAPLAPLGALSDPRRGRGSARAGARRGPPRGGGRRAHGDSISTTARQAMPSARPSAPSPSARVALTETGACSTALRRSTMAAVCGARRGASAMTVQSALAQA